MDLPPPPPPPPPLPPTGFSSFPGDDDEPSDSTRGKAWFHENHYLGLLIVLIALFSAYRLVKSYGAGAEGPMLLGVPTMVALLIVYLPAAPDRTTRANTARSISLVFLIGVLTLPEGIICWIMALPILFLVAIIAIANAPDNNRRHQQNRRMVLWVPLLILSLEGAVIGDSVSPHGRVTAVESYDMAGAAVAERLATTPEFEDPGGFLGIGFPTAVGARGAGLEVGDTRVIEFTGGSPEAPSELHMTITERSDGRAVFTVTDDTTPLANWMDIHESEVTWTQTESGTEVSWTMRWERKVNPGVYFGPAQQFGMNQAAEYLLDSVVG